MRNYWLDREKTDIAKVRRGVWWVNRTKIAGMSKDQACEWLGASCQHYSLRVRTNISERWHGFATIQEMNFFIDMLHKDLSMTNNFINFSEDIYKPKQTGEIAITMYRNLPYGGQEIVRERTR